MYRKYSLLMFFLLLSACSNSVETTNQTRTFTDTELQDFFEPLPPVPVPSNNPITDEKIKLGKILFVDPRLSKDQQLSCLSCHSPTLGYADNLTLSLGFDRAVLPRNTPSVIQTGYYQSLFWDGRATTLEEQALGPIQAELEMNQDLDTLVEVLTSIEGYKPLFKSAFGDADITVERIAKALATYQRSINIINTKFDQFIEGDHYALNEQEKLGMEVFVGKGRCILCHSGPNFTDDQYHNVGVDSDDIGRYEITKRDEDKGSFRTPGLRGIIYTAPYLHNGSEKTLLDVVNFYNRGGDIQDNLSPLIQPLDLTHHEKEALISFLRVVSGVPPITVVPDLPQ